MVIVNKIKPKNMKIFYFFFAFFLLYSCQESIISNQDEIQKPVHKSSIDSSKIDRLAVNEDYSIEVVQNFDNDSLLSVDYAVVNRNSGDEYQILNLSNGSSSKIHIFDTDIQSLTGNENVYTSFIPSDPYTYGCECKGDGDTNDCQVNTYLGTIKYCNGTLCGSCSLQISFSTSGGKTLTHIGSAVILPQNL